jgi:NMDA receptor-regulated protein 1
LILYHIDFLEEQEDLGEALAMLHQYTESGVIMNKLHAATVRPRLLLKLGRTDEAVEAYRALVDRNPDCYGSYRDLLRSQAIDLGGKSCQALTLCIDSSSRCLDRRSNYSCFENSGRLDTKVPEGSRTPTVSPHNQLKGRLFKTSGKVPATRTDTKRPFTLRRHQAFVRGYR